MLDFLFGAYEPQRATIYNPLSSMEAALGQQQAAQTGSLAAMQSPFTRGFMGAMAQARECHKKSDSDYLTDAELDEIKKKANFRRAMELEGADFGEI